MPNDSTPSRDDVSDQLDATKASLTSRFDALKDEVDDVKETVRTTLREHPLASAAGALGAGLVVGWLFSGRPTRSQWASRYATAVEDDLRAALESGADADTIVDEVLRDRVPIVVEAAPPSPKSSLLRRAAGTVTQAALHVALYQLSNRLAQRALDDPSDEAA